MLPAMICYLFAALLVNSYLWFALNVRVCGAVNDHVEG